MTKSGLPSGTIPRRTDALRREPLLTTHENRFSCKATARRAVELDAFLLIISLGLWRRSWNGSIERHDTGMLAPEGEAAYQSIQIGHDRHMRRVISDVYVSCIAATDVQTVIVKHLLKFVHRLH